MRNINYFHKLDYTQKKDAFTYQKTAFDAIKDLDYSAIFHEQGLGKTKIAIDLMLYWLEKRNIDTVFVVTKKQLIRNWEKELDFHTHIRSKVLTNDRHINFMVFNSTARVILTNFETISTEKERIILYLKTRNVAIIIDESTKIKNPESQLTKNFMEVSNLFKIKTIMTGTPVANRPYDIWSQICFLDGGDSLGKDFNEFKKNTNLSNDLIQNKEKRVIFEESTASIYDKIKGFTVRETKNSGVISLPNKKYINVLCNFEKIQMNMYDQLKRDYVLLLQQGDNTLLDESDVTLKRLLRLIQITSNPRLIDDLFGYESGNKVNLNNFLREII